MKKTPKTGYQSKKKVLNFGRADQVQSSAMSSVPVRNSSRAPIAHPSRVRPEG